MRKFLWKFMARYWPDPQLLRSLDDGLTRLEQARRKADYRNPLSRYSGKVFSQTDEDGIIAEILRRIEIIRGSFCEFGVENGLECNTLALAAQGWRGFWISGEPLAFPLAGIDPQFFRFDQAWVDLDNIIDLFRRNADAMGLQQVDVLSFDLDSRDLFFLEKLLLAGIRPALVVAEYNAKFAPPILWSMPPDDPSTWKGGDYFGASLASLDEMFKGHGYQLVACNPATGANAFFVRGEFANRFEDVPRDLSDIYVPPYYKIPSYGHGNDPRTVRRLFQIGQNVFVGKSRPEFQPLAEGQ